MVGNRISELRKKKNWSQEELAKRLLVSSRAIGKWESGESEPSFSNLNALADVFEVSVDSLLERSETSKGVRKYSNWSIALIVIFVVFAMIVSVGFAVHGIGLANEIQTIQKTLEYNRSSTASGVPGIGQTFPVSELTHVTITYAASQGVVITPESDTFVQWQNSLKNLYTIHGDEYWYNLIAIVDYGPLIWLVVLESYLLFSLSTSIVLLVLCLKNRLHVQKLWSLIFIFASLNLPAFFTLFVYHLRSKEA